MDLIQKNIKIFKDYCAKRKIQYDTLCEGGAPAMEIIRQSRFADLLIADAEIYVDEKYKGGPTGFEREILKAAECPVIIAPESFNGIDEIIFCYDGGRSAIYSMKQFDYMFPELRRAKIILIEVTKANNAYVTQIEKVKEWLCQRYDNIKVEILHGKTKDELFQYLLQKDNAIFVMGSYGRSNLSRLFKRTASEKVLKTTNLPVFITHP
jgi:nucleotide-binding universal stress UspA family protein